MTDVTYNNRTGKHYPTKAALKRDVKQAPEDVSIDCMSLFGGYSGSIQNAPDGNLYIVGPTAYERKWYATITKRGNKITCS